MGGHAHCHPPLPSIHLLSPQQPNPLRRHFARRAFHNGDPDKKAEEMRGFDPAPPPCLAKEP